MMRLCVTFVVAVLLTGCGGGGDTFTGDAKAVNDLCLNNSGTAAYCTCTTKMLQEKLTPEAFAQIAKVNPEGDLSATLDIINTADKACAAK